MAIDISVEANVTCTDGPCGKCTYVVVNPVKEKVTHLVVRPSTPPHIERLVPIDWVTETDAEIIELKHSKDELAKQERFEETEFIKTDSTTPYGANEMLPAGGGLGTVPFVVWPYATAERPEYIRMEHEHIPESERAVRRGASVEATDGGVGHVGEFLVSPEDDQITHLVLHEGHLWGKKDVSIPVSAIDRIEEDVVFLNLSKDEVGALPSIPIHRREL
jgi:sporulation protein YlmC with PRC-barrel domain